MASFTDQILQFNPYISEVPVNDYVTVGMEKQRQYEQGVQKVQSYIDNVAGLDVAKDVHKEYLNQYMSQLQNSIGKVVGGADWSNNQLVQQVGGLRNRIIKDPIMQNALVSTQAYKKGLGEMEKARAEGKSGVENEYAFQSQAQSWLSDKDATSSFNARYTPYRDVRKKMFDILKEVGVDTKLTQLPFQRNADGTVMLDATNRPMIDSVMLETTTEGKSAEKIKRAIQLGLDESDINQLNIEAQYHFRGLDAMGMKKITDDTYQSRLEENNHVLADLQVKRMTNVNDPDFQNRIDEEIQNYKGASSNLIIKYKQDMEMLNANPEGFKGKFYTENYLDQVGNAFSTSKNSFKYLDNPYKKQLNEERDFNLKYAEFQDKQLLERAKLELEKYKIDSDITKERLKAEKEGKSVAGLISNPYIDPNDPKKDALGIDDFKSDIAAKEEFISSAKRDIMEKALIDIPADQRDEKLQELRTAYDIGERGSMDHRVEEYFRNTDRVKLDVDNKKTALLNLEKDLPTTESITRGQTGIRAWKDGKAVDISAANIVDFNSKFKEVMPDPVFMAGETPAPRVIDEEKANRLFTSPQDKMLYEIKKNSLSGKKLNESDKTILSRINEVRTNINDKNQKVISENNKVIAERIKPLLPAFQPERYNIDVSNGEKMTATRGIVNLFLGQAESNKEAVGKSPNFKYEDAVALNDDKANTTYGIYRKGNEAYITIAGNSKYKTQYIPISIDELNRTYDGAFSRPFDPIKHTLALTGGRTTNVQGKGYQTAYFQKADFPAVSKYGVRADVEKGMSGYQLKLHLYDPRKKQWVERTPFYGTPEELLVKVRTIGDLTVEQLLKLTPEEIQAIKDEKK